MNQKIFRRFERFCIKYDIAIDEEDYSHGWEDDAIDNNWPLEEDKLPIEKMIYNFDSLESSLSQVNEKLKEKCFDPEKQKDEMRRLIIAKRMRAVLQKENSTDALDSLDYLALYLLKHIPAISEGSQLEELDQWSEITINFLLHIMYLNEIAACYRGFTSIGYADRCLELIKKTLKGEGKTPYELIALYNKGQGYRHVGFNEKAFEEFEKVAKALVEDNKYFDNNGKPWQFKLADKDLFKMVAVIPALMMQVECLSKMQRGWETGRVFQKIHGLTDYQKARKLILETRILIDQNECENECKKVKEKLNKLKEQDIIDKKPILYGQYIALKFEGNQLLAEDVLSKISSKGKGEKYKLDKEDLSNLRKISSFLKEYDKLKALLEKNKWKNKIEESQAVLLWVKGLKIVTRCVQLELVTDKFGEKTGENRTNINTLKDVLKDVASVLIVYIEMGSCQEQLFHDITGKVIEDKDKGYRANWEEIHRSYLKNLKELRDLLRCQKYAETFKIISIDAQEINAELAKKEKAALGKVLNNSKRLPEWEKVKYEQQKKLVDGENILPKDELKEIRKFLATQFFCSPEEAGPPRECSGCETFKCKEPKCKDVFQNRIKDNTECRVTEGTKKEELTVQHYYDVIISKNRKSIDKLLSGSKKEHLIEDGFGLIVLQRWNSYTPALAASEGGGYFLFQTEGKKVKYGIVIDPGYDFLSNFFSEGFSINDIDAVLISHDHPDHLDDFTKIITLKHEVQKNRFKKEGFPESRKITAVLSKGCYDKLKEDIKACYYVFKDTIVPDAPGKDIPSSDYSIPLGDSNIRLRIKRALHHDPSNNDSIGFVIELEKDGGNKTKIGFPCDTKWEEQVFKQFEDCDVICFHAGSILDDDQLLFQGFDDQVLNNINHEKEHLYLPGTVIFSKGFKGKDDQLRIISEFGEEFKNGLRIDYAKKLANFAAGNKKGEYAPVIPSDSGLLINVLEKTIACACCREFYKCNFIEFEPYGSNERLFVICKNCKTKLTAHQREIIYRNKIIRERTHESDLLV